MKLPKRVAQSSRVRKIVCRHNCARRPDHSTLHHCFVVWLNILRTVAGRPEAMQNAGILPCTTELAPMIEPSPIEAPAVTTTPSLSQTLRPMKTLRSTSKGRRVGATCGEVCSLEYCP